MEPKFQTQRYQFLRTQLVTDLLNIDEEVSRIAVNVGDAGECAAVATEVFESAKVALEEVESRVAYELRETPFNGKQRSEAQVKTEVPIDERTKKAQLDLSEARLDAGLWKSLVDALRKKADALDNVGYLVHAGYLTHDFIRARGRESLREGRPPERVRVGQQ